MILKIQIHLGRIIIYYLLILEERSSKKVVYIVIGFGPESRGSANQKPRQLNDAVSKSRSLVKNQNRISKTPSQPYKTGG